MTKIENPTGSNAEIDFENGKLKRVFPDVFWVERGQLVEWAITSPGQDAELFFPNPKDSPFDWTSEKSKSGKIKGRIRDDAEKDRLFKYSVTAAGDTIDPRVGVRR
jgi:hypothetical protein